MIERPLSSVALLIWLAAVPANAQVRDLGIRARDVAGPVNLVAETVQRFSANPASGPAPLSVTFKVSSMPPGQNKIDFGDGTGGVMHGAPIRRSR